MPSPTQHKPLKVAVIGTGNVGIQLHNYFLGKKVLSKLFGRTATTLDFHGNKLTVLPQKELVPSAYDCVFLCVPDSEIANTCSFFQPEDAIWVHMSGSMPITEIPFTNSAVCYFFQSMSKSEPPVDFSQLPLYLELLSKSNPNRLLELLERVDCKAKQLEGGERLKLHLAGVLVNNFGNQLLDITAQVLAESTLSLSDLAKLYQRTFEKAAELGTKDAQTGPAIRKDIKTMKLHGAVLKQLDAEAQQLYHTFTKRIQNQNIE